MLLDVKPVCRRSIWSFVLYFISASLSDAANKLHYTDQLTDSAELTEVNSFYHKIKLFFSIIGYDALQIIHSRTILCREVGLRAMCQVQEKDELSLTSNLDFYFSSPTLVINYPQNSVDLQETSTAKTRMH